MASTRKRATVAASIVLALVGVAVLWLGSSGARTSAEGAAAAGSELARPGPPDCQTVVSGPEAAQSLPP